MVFASSFSAESMTNEQAAKRQQILPSNSESQARSVPAHFGIEWDLKTDCDLLNQRL